MDGLTPHRDTGLSLGDVRPVQAAPALEAPERRVTSNQESSSDSPDLQYKQRDSAEFSREALELSLNDAPTGEQIAGQSALHPLDVGDALGKLNADQLAHDPNLQLLTELDPALPPVPFKSIRQSPDFTEPSQEGTGNLG